MSETTITQQAPVIKTQMGLGLTAKSRQRLKDYFLAYLLLFPAFLIIFTFGIFPLIFSVYESTLRGLNKVVGTYDGLGNYVRAIDNLAYLLGFWLAILAIYLAIGAIGQAKEMAVKYEERPAVLSLSAAILAGGMALFLRFLFAFLPELLGVGDKMLDAQQAGEVASSAMFWGFFKEALKLPLISEALWLALGALLAGIALSVWAFQSRPGQRRNNDYFNFYLRAAILFLSGLFLIWFTWGQVQAAYTEALAEGESLDIWSQLITISAGFVLLLLSWLVWKSANHRDSTAGTFFRLSAAIMLLVGAWVLIGELPQAIDAGNSDWWQGLKITVYYSLGSLPIQFTLSLTLATFLFQNIRGKGLLRVIYFLPYITPTVGAAAAFRIIFSGANDGPMNLLFTKLGLQAQGWLNEPNGIFRLLLGPHISNFPDWASGPSLSLSIIILFGIWSFMGFNIVIFLAGLGSIPSELYEAASMDGAGRWAQFRHVTLPLLSPTIYFLSLYAVIGTFKAFNHIVVLRNGAALGTADTASIVIFDAFKRDTRYGYAAALAILLLIIVMGLTVINNRIASRRVFYG